MKQQIDSLDDIFEGFEIIEHEPLTSKNRGGVTIWLPEEYKAKFQELQQRTGRRFGKKVQQLLMKSIDRVAS